MEMRTGDHFMLPPGVANVMVGLGWSHRTTSHCDVDASALLLDGSGKKIDHVSFGRHVTRDGAVTHLGDDQSITGNEERVGDYLLGVLAPLARQHHGVVEKIEVEPHRANVFACFGEPRVTLSTHLDTVPPFFASRDDGEFIWGRGACDVKGIIAAMVCATERLLEGGVRNFGLLFVVGEERNSAGAYHAALHPRGSRFIINGEPTENKLALGSKGALRFAVKAQGRMAHSAYPELGESAIEKLLDALARVRAVALPCDPLLGPCTLNIGQISGGRAPNVIADAAEATLMYRLVGDAEPIDPREFEDQGIEVRFQDYHHPE